MKANNGTQAQAKWTQQKKRTNPGTGTADAPEEADKPRHKHSKRSQKSGRTQAKAQQTQQKKRMNPGTGTADVAEEADEPRHRHSRHSRESKATATVIRFPVVLNLSVFRQR